MTNNKKIKIALIGTRGIPACYGGFETFAEQISVRLVERGHEVTVFGRKKFFEIKDKDYSYKGVKVRYAPTIMSKYFETIINALTSFLIIKKSEADIILLCNAANSPFSFIARLRGFKIITNVDGIERKRAKWNFLGKAWYRLGEFTSVLFSNGVIADAKSICKYYEKTYAITPKIIEYGSESKKISDKDCILKNLGISGQKYILYVSRLEPENNAFLVIKAFKKYQTHETDINTVSNNLFLVIVGDAPYAEVYKKSLYEEADKNPNIIFAGYQFGDAYQELQLNAYMYIQATEVGGTHPALIESMAFGNAILANGTPENLEVLGGAGLYYLRNNFEDLAQKIKFMDQNEEIRLNYKILSSKRAKQKFSWEHITDKYENYIRKFFSYTSNI